MQQQARLQAPASGRRTWKEADKSAGGKGRPLEMTRSEKLVQKSEDDRLQARLVPNWEHCPAPLQEQAAEASLTLPLLCLSFPNSTESLSLPQNVMYNTDCNSLPTLSHLEYSLTVFYGGETPVCTEPGDFSGSLACECLETLGALSLWTRCFGFGEGYQQTKEKTWTYSHLSGFTWWHLDGTEVLL